MNTPFSHQSRPTRSDAARAFAFAAALCATTAQQHPVNEPGDGVQLTLGEAVDRALRVVDDGAAWRARLDRGDGALVYSVDVARGARTIDLEIDAATGEVLRRRSRRDDRAALVAATTTSLTFAIEAVERRIGGTAIAATMGMRNGAPVVVVRTLEPQHGAVNEVRLDGRTGRILPGADAIPQDAPRLPRTAPGTVLGGDPNEGYTRTFFVARRDLRPTGRNPFFVLEPGHEVRLAGRRGDREVGLSVRVLEETRRVDGVETRVVERRETEDGQPTRVVRSYCAISRRTNDVFCLGEDAVRFEDGERVPGASWRSGQDGARFGLAMPGTPLAGARFVRASAAGAAADRAEIRSVGGTLTTPAGRFENVVEIATSRSLAGDPTNGRRPSRAWYAPGVGLVGVGGLRLRRVDRPGAAGR